MKTTWIWFMPDPIDDKLATRYEKIKAIENFLKEAFPGYREIDKVSYGRYQRGWKKPLTTGLIVIIDRIDGLLALLYERKHDGSYGLVVDHGYGTTPVTHYRFTKEERREKINMLPPNLDIKKYLTLCFDSYEKDLVRL